MRKIALVILVLCTLLLFNACGSEQTGPTLIQRADSYASLMNFHNSLGQVMLYYASLENRGYTQIIFVHSEEEFLTGDFPDDAVIAWPSVSSRIRLDGLNTWIRENEKEAAIEAYALSYPLTCENLVDNWEEILEVWLSFRLGGFLHQWVAEEFDRLIDLELRILHEVFDVAGIDVTEYGFAYPIQSRHIGQILFEIYYKLDEEAQLRLLTETPHFMARYGDEKRRRAVSEARRLAEQEAYDNAE